MKRKVNKKRCYKNIVTWIIKLMNKMNLMSYGKKLN